MFKRKIFLFIFFLTIPLSSCSLKKNNTKINQIENQKTHEDKKISNVIERKSWELYISKSNYFIKHSRSSSELKNLNYEKNISSIYTIIIYIVWNEQSGSY